VLNGKEAPLSANGAVLLMALVSVAATAIEDKELSKNLGDLNQWLEQRGSTQRMNLRN